VAAAAKPPTENGAAAPVNAPPKETTPADAKPVAPEGANQVQSKIRVPVMAEIVKKVSPEYPTIARSQKVRGKVDVEAEISEKGDVTRAKAVSGPVLLRDAAEQALMKWKFKPATIDGVNIPSKARISIEFSLQ
jgi:TonB family protein